MTVAKNIHYIDNDVWTKQQATTGKNVKKQGYSSQHCVKISITTKYKQTCKKGAQKRHTLRAKQQKWKARIQKIPKHNKATTGRKSIEPRHMFKKKTQKGAQTKHNSEMKDKKTKLYHRTTTQWRDV